MKIGLFVCLALFAIACWLPALEFKHSNSPDSIMTGLNILMVGWSGVFAGVMAWYANPFWALGLIFGFFRKPVVAMIAGIV